MNHISFTIEWIENLVGKVWRSSFMCSIFVWNWNGII